MNLRVTLYDTLVNNQLLVRIYDLDNEGRDGKLQVRISGNKKDVEIDIKHLSLSPIDVFVSETPVTGRIHEVTAKIFSADLIQLHDTDTRMIKLGK